VGISHERGTPVMEKGGRLMESGTCAGAVLKVGPAVDRESLSSEYGTYETVKARFWPWLSGETPQTLLSGSLFACRIRRSTFRGGVEVRSRRECMINAQLVHLFNQFVPGDAVQ
jgi:hypothetical protein